MLSGVYKFSWPDNDWFYIGSSFWINKRWSEHKSDVKYGRHCNKKLLNVWKKYGEPVMTVLEYTENYIEAEQLLLDKHFENPHCLNLAPVADSPTRKLYLVPDLINLYTGEVFESTKISVGDLVVRLDLNPTHHVSEFVHGKRESCGGWVYKDLDLSNTKHFKYYGKVLVHDTHGEVKVIRVADAVKAVNTFENYNFPSILSGINKVLSGMQKQCYGWRVKA